jgi:hypothetical protein
LRAWGIRRPTNWALNYVTWTCIGDVEISRLTPFYPSRRQLSPSDGCCRRFLSFLSYRLPASVFHIKHWKYISPMFLSAPTTHVLHKDIW